MNRDSVIFFRWKEIEFGWSRWLQILLARCQMAQKTFFNRNFGGGSVMVWAAISSRGSSELVFLEGKQNSLKYVETFDQYLFQLCDKFGDDAVIFQHDNAPLHSSRLTKTLLQERNLKVLKWPARSPDLNPIENVWGLLVGEVYSNGKQYFSVQELKNALNKTWKKLDEKSLKPFLVSLKNRVQGLIIKKVDNKHY